MGSNPTDFIVPKIEVKLPTAPECVYSKEHSFSGLEKIKIPIMCSKEQDILSVESPEKRKNIINDLLKSVLSSDYPGLDVGTILSADKMAILIALHVSGFNEILEFSYKCGILNCGKENKAKVDLSKLPIIRMKMKPIEAYKNEFAFKFPITGWDITFKLTDGNTQDAIRADIEGFQKVGSERRNTTTLRHQLLSVGGDYSKEVINKVAPITPAKDYNAMMDYLNENGPSIDMSLKTVCKECGGENNILIPFWNYIFSTI